MRVTPQGWGWESPHRTGDCTGTGSPHESGDCAGNRVTCRAEDRVGVTPGVWGWHWEQRGRMGLGMALGVQSAHGAGDGPGDRGTTWTSQQVCGHAQPVVTTVLPVNPHTERAALHSPLLPPAPTPGVEVLAQPSPSVLLVGPLSWADLGGVWGPAHDAQRLWCLCWWHSLCCAQQPLPQGCRCPGLGQPGGEPMVTQGQGRCQPQPLLCQQARSSPH